MQKYQALSHIQDTICHNNPKSAYVISTFPPIGYQLNSRKSGILNGEVIVPGTRR